MEESQVSEWIDERHSRAGSARSQATHKSGSFNTHYADLIMETEPDLRGFLIRYRDRRGRRSAIANVESVIRQLDDLRSYEMTDPIERETTEYATVLRSIQAKITLIDRSGELDYVVASPDALKLMEDANVELETLMALRKDSPNLFPAS